MLIEQRNADEGLTLEIALQSVEGQPVPGGKVGLSLQATEGSGLWATYEATGIVPAGATRARVGFRVNLECGCSHAGDFALREVVFDGGVGAATYVSDFARGLTGWELGTQGTARLDAYELGEGRVLHTTVAAGQPASLSSTAFPVTPGATYTVRFLARVAPGSEGSGYLTTIFIGQSEVARNRVQIAPTLVPMGEVETDADGKAKFVLRGAGEGHVLAHLVHLGDDDHWPSGVTGKLYFGDPK